MKTVFHNQTHPKYLSFIKKKLVLICLAMYLRAFKIEILVEAHVGFLNYIDFYKNPDVFVINQVLVYIYFLLFFIIIFIIS